MRNLFTFKLPLLVVLMIGLTIALHALPIRVMAQMTELNEFTGTTPDEVVEEFLATDRPNEFTDDDVGILQLSTAGNYAYASYYWGEGGGFLIIQRDESREWTILAADGGAPNGGQTFVEYGVPLADAQALWAAVEADRAP
jgi:hypothetical protein